MLNPPRQLCSHFAQILNVPLRVRLRSSLAAAAPAGFLNILIIYVACMKLDGAHAVNDNAPGSLRFPHFDVGCGVQSRQIDC